MLVDCFRFNVFFLLLFFISVYVSSHRKLDGRPKLFLRRFFSSIGLNSVGRLVKGARSSSMEQLSLPNVPRASSASPSPTRRPQPTLRIQRTPSLQTLHTVNQPKKKSLNLNFPLCGQVLKVSSAEFFSTNNAILSQLRSFATRCCHWHSCVKPPLCRAWREEQSVQPYLGRCRYLTAWHPGRRQKQNDTQKNETRLNQR